MKNNKPYTTKEWKALFVLSNTLKGIRDDAAMYEHCLNGNAIYDKCSSALLTVKKILNDEEENEIE